MIKNVAFLGLILFLFICTGCEQFMSSDQLIRTPTLELNSMAEIRYYVTHNIRYLADEKEHWQAPQETIDKGTGDCEDFALFAGYYAKKLGYDVYLVGVHTPVGDHMILKLDGVYYEAQDMSPYRYADYYEKIYISTLENALKRCYFVYGSREVVDYDFN